MLSVGLTLLALAIVGTQLFYPFHMIIGVGIYVLSLVPFLWRIYLSRDTWRKYHAYKLTAGFLERERRRFVFGLLLIVAVAVFLWVRPIGVNPFSGMDDEAVASLVRDDLYRAVTAMDYLESTGNELLTTLAEEGSDTNQTEDITNAFESFLAAVAYSESLTEVHRYFASIPYSYWDIRLESFLIANSLYAKKYELVHRIMLAVDGNGHRETVLNQLMPTVGRNNVYNEMVFRFYEPKTRIRLTGGFVYQWLFIGDRPRSDQSFTLLRDKAYGSYEYLRSNIGVTILRTPGVIGDAAEQRMFEAWFPIQKGVATAMGRAIISTRGKEGLITAEQARTMGQYLEPGDIMLQRRNWHISNVGIPGFWTHSALYTGTLEEMEAYFATEFPYAGYERFSVYLAAEYPNAYAIYNTGEVSGDRPAVIEAIEPGVVIQTLPVSADADFVVALRPELTKRDKLLALSKAFGNIGKPYDFNFDFNTRDAMVCSELIYDAYFERLPEKQGLQFETSLVNGRPIVSPFDMAAKFVAEWQTPNPQLSFVYFLRSDEGSDQAYVSDEVTFVRSLEWSKFSFLRPEVGE